ncbi:MAG: TolC family protein [Singulisphaera sp.]
MRRDISRRLRHVACACILIAGSAKAQGPTIGAEESPAPGSDAPLLGRSPGSGGGGLGDDPGSSGNLLGGRPGASTPRVPTSVSTPGGTAGPTDAQTGISGPRPLPSGRVPLYGSLEVSGETDEGPPGGLTLDQAINRLLRENLELRAQFIEIPLAEADILTASLRANPIFYADSQLIPYGKYTRDRPGGQTQYDVNISYPLDVSHKRRARTQVAVRAKRVLEAQYQDAARRSIDNLYTAYVDVLAARQNVRYARASVEGLQKVLLVTQQLYEKDQTNRADVNRVKVQVDASGSGWRTPRDRCGGAAGSWGAS